jgi:hypothetical protein
MDIDFSKENPYSKLLVEALHFAGPVAEETRWVEGEDGIFREEVLKFMSQEDQKKLVGEIHHNIY